MKKLALIFLLGLSLLQACKNTDNRDFSKNPDTLKLDYKANRDMFIILSILPDSLTSTYKWLRQERTDMYRSERENGYVIDSTGNMQNIVSFNNDFLEMKKDDVNFSLRAYQISDGEYIILTKEVTPDTTMFKGFQLFRDYAPQVTLEEVIGRYTDNFYKDATNQTCLDGLNLKASDFDFDISKTNKLFVKLINPEKLKMDDCLKGTYLTLTFSDKVGPFNFESIK